MSCSEAGGKVDRFQSDFGIIADYLKHSREDPGYIPTKKIEYKHPHETLDLLSRFTGDEKYRQIFRQERGEVIDMRSPLDYWLEKGREEGREEGIEVGEKQALLQSLKTIMETLNLTKDQAMDVLKVPETEREYYLSHI